MTEVPTQERGMIEKTAKKRFSLAELQKKWQSLFHGDEDTDTDKDKEPSDPFFVDDLTDIANSLEISTKYPGDDYEKRDFTRLGSELLQGNRLLSVSQNHTLDASPLLVVAKDSSGDSSGKRAIKSESDLAALFETGRDLSVPCYFDLESKKLVVFLGDVYGHVHHGVEANTHRDTYKAVILSRALAIASYDSPETDPESESDDDLEHQKKLKAVIKNPSEFKDGTVLSCNIFESNGRRVIDLSSKRVTPELIQILKNLNILLLDEYIDLMSSENGGLRTAIEEILGEKLTNDSFIRRVLADFNYANQAAYWAEDQGGIIFSPGLFIGTCPEEDLGGWEPFRTRSFREMNSDSYDMYADLLLAGQSVPISMVVYKNRQNGKCAFVVSESHPDAARYFSSVAKPGRMGFSHRYAVADLTGEIAIDMEGLRAHVMNLEDDEINPETFPLKITVTGINRAPLEEDLISKEHLFPTKPKRKDWPEHLGDEKDLTAGHVKMQVSPDIFIDS
ncbi:MAG: hypothetical protein CO156_05320 [Candidatus Pacebacteria bacterium CG_4_9_14_3_um_filter_40_12]|nr:hypothetical protein [Candidatus Paceibacterota bacterium]PIR63659.1 MAG: hypothetical protein COU64_03625 [Candidatus Pacebacteria bacterium CG10_big_fil_rev_8_21_14_0_10_40_26]PIZ78762.1 MAG: hypothetical protein COY01_03995 [Candidatus Pacebacteria bacterium CG_4_10_14_0_2_um_filter_40_20]PJA68387.1 MAG: hypothetical protein CO156_05320 [Candidatus Pacebacteria bacterium CG_4_9_14_3_um_filter_40_12]PJC41249.1 MAG: hypothetical protein CO041_05390 [Candidatus Pacebacteria bacterium CG_4_9_